MTREQFTISETATGYMLTEITNFRQEFIEPNHAKFEWVSKNLGRIVNITESGRWNSQKDYLNYYAVPKVTNRSQMVTTAKPKVEVKLTKLDDLTINPDLFIPLPTNTVFDKFVSEEGGFLPGSNIMAAGAPGIGKTTVLLDLVSNLNQAGKKVLFISAEMNRIDMARYLKRFPHWGQLPILFLSDYEECPKEAVEKILDEGWDIVLTDSYTEVNDTVKEECGLSRGKVEKWFLNLMSSHNDGANQLLKHTCFVTILQLSKGGNFVGSNKLKHMTTSMMSLQWDGSENSGQRYMEFSKNRVGQVNKKLYFSLGNGVVFDEARYVRDLENDAIVAREKVQLGAESDSFDRIFGLSDLVAETESIEVE
jgi:predicted ATP-dependent serine protease